MRQAGTNSFSGDSEGNGLTLNSGMLILFSRKNTGRRWTIALVQKAIDAAWDVWEQWNNIEHNTMHPRAAAAALDIQVKLQLLCRKGSKGFLSQDKLLFSKSEVKSLKGEPIEMQQWISSVLHAKRRGAQAKNDFEATMEAERMLMQQWLHQTQAHSVHSCSTDQTPTSTPGEASHIFTHCT
jgi:hypothetical protein